MSIDIYGQEQFELKSKIGLQNVSVNGVDYMVDSIGKKISTNYPEFDTLTFKSDSQNLDSPIICNFKPDTTYILSMACCGSFDIIPMSKYNCDSLKYWDFEKDFDKIQNQFMDKPFISIKTEGNSNDTIYAWHADAACETEHHVLGKELWRLGVPPKCFYWNNITAVVFFKKSTINNTPQEEETAKLLGFDNIEILTSITFRLFDDQRFVLILNEDTQNVKIKYQ
tara:strand:+ start:1942 stop:2616 length:675 start_codon:yes stop_codon:yes gene_type:complete